jgi:UDPglucose 6-dehydrogenase
VSLVPLASRAPEISSEQDLMAAVKGADLVILGTEWKQYREVDPAELGELVKTKTVIDGRNVLDVARWQQAGWKVIALGRNIQNG